MFTFREVSKSVLNLGFYFPLFQNLIPVMSHKCEQSYMLDYSRKSNSACYMKSFIYICKGSDWGRDFLKRRRHSNKDETKNELLMTTSANMI